MKRMAIIPWGKDYYKDKIFYVDDMLNRDNASHVYVELRNYLNKSDWEVHTVDEYPDLAQVDLFVFFTFHIGWYKQIFDMHLENRAIYVAFEPPVVDINHSTKGIKKLLKYFEYVITWNDDLVDNRRIFKFMLPYYFLVDCTEDDFEKKKLLVNISGNKHSKVEDELYSERERIISYLDDSDDFELYGVGWDVQNHASYRGIAHTKREIYHRFKFALCLENMKNINGYVTEKILDCLCAGIVPIYWGASNIDKYIPSNCFIPYEKFSSLDELITFLKSMDKKVYNDYLIAAKNYLDSEEKNVFSLEEFGKQIINVYEKLTGTFKASKSFYFDFILKLVQIVIWRIRKVLSI